jgi:hypothetical protein
LQERQKNQCLNAWWTAGMAESVRKMMTTCRKDRKVSAVNGDELQKRQTNQCLKAWRTAGKAERRCRKWGRLAGKEEHSVHVVER